MSTKTIEQFFKRAILLALVAKGWLSLPPFEPEHFAELYRLTDETMAVVYNDGDVQIETLDKQSSLPLAMPLVSTNG